MGMNHMNGRVEDSITGRMLSADPHIPNKAYSQAYNRYSYVYNNPVTLGDPSGFCPQDKNAICLPNNPDYAGGRCRKCMGVDPGGDQAYHSNSLPMGSPQGMTAYDVTDCSGCSSGSNISNGLTAGQETAALYWGGTTIAVPNMPGVAAITLPDGSVMALNSSGNVIGATLPTPTNIPMLAANNAEITITATLNGYASQGLLQQYNQQQAAAQAAVWAQIQRVTTGTPEVAGAWAGTIEIGAERALPDIPKVIPKLPGFAAVAAGIYVDARDIADGIPGSLSMFFADAGIGTGAVVVGGYPGLGIAVWWAGVKSYPGGVSAYFSAVGAAEMCAQSTSSCGP
jgi:hypothetical protein